MAKVIGTYRGLQDGTVIYRGKPLRMTAEGRKSSPTGFNWGYYGSGAYALAHSVLASACGECVADKLAMEFKFAVIGELTFGQPFELKRADVLKWVEAQNVR